MKHILLFLIVIANVFADDVNQFENGEQDPGSTEANGKAVDATGLTKIRNRYYYFSTNANETVRKSWQGASNFCKSRGMKLTTIESKAENKALEKKVKDYFGILQPNQAGVLWIGLNDLEKEGDFRWVSNGKKAGFTHWFPNEPNNSGAKQQPEHCVAVTAISSGTGWNDLDCTSENYFICEL